MDKYDRVPVRNFLLIDKSLWPDGPWKIEPDRVTWHDMDTGLPCIINRHSQGFWLGYVGIPNRHKLYGIHADDVSLQAHNGVEFSGVPLTDQANQDGLGHLRDWYWFGFSCSYWDDYTPNSPGYKQLLNDDPTAINSYRNAEYVKSECRKLAEQLGAIK